MMHPHGDETCVTCGFSKVHMTALLDKISFFYSNGIESISINMSESDVKDIVSRKCFHVFPNEMIYLISYSNQMESFINKISLIVKLNEVDRHLLFIKHSFVQQFVPTSFPINDTWSFAGWSKYMHSLKGNIVTDVLLMATWLSNVINFHVINTSWLTVVVNENIYITGYDHDMLSQSNHTMLKSSDGRFYHPSSIHDDDILTDSFYNLFVKSGLIKDEFGYYIPKNNATQPLAMFPRGKMALGTVKFVSSMSMDNRIRIVQMYYTDMMTRAKAVSRLISGRVYLWHGDVSMLDMGVFPSKHGIIGYISDPTHVLLSVADFPTSQTLTKDEFCSVLEFVEESNTLYPCSLIDTYKDPIGVYYCTASDLENIIEDIGELRDRDIKTTIKNQIVADTIDGDSPVDDNKNSELTLTTQLPTDYLDFDELPTVKSKVISESNSSSLITKAQSTSRLNSIACSTLLDVVERHILVSTAPEERLARFARSVTYCKTHFRKDDLFSLRAGAMNLVFGNPFFKYDNGTITFSVPVDFDSGSIEDHKLYATVYGSLLTAIHRAVFINLIGKETVVDQSLTDPHTLAYVLDDLTNVAKGPIYERFLHIVDEAVGKHWIYYNEVALPSFGTRLYPNTSTATLAMMLQNTPFIEILTRAYIVKVLGSPVTSQVLESQLLHFPRTLERASVSVQRRIFFSLYSGKVFKACIIIATDQSIEGVYSVLTSMPRVVENPKTWPFYTDVVISKDPRLISRCKYAIAQTTTQRVYEQNPLFYPDGARMRYHTYSKYMEDAAIRLKDPIPFGTAISSVVYAVPQSVRKYFSVKPPKMLQSVEQV